MNVSRMLLASFVFFISGCGSLTQGPAEFPDGAIKFAGHDDGSYFPCDIPLQSGDHILQEFEPNKCRNDRMNYFKLENAPSATFITLYSDVHYIGFPGIPIEKWCQEDSGVKYGWKFKLKTYIHPVTTAWIAISTLRAATPGEIVTVGVILVSKDLISGDQIDELSCVKIERSALP